MRKQLCFSFTGISSNIRSSSSTYRISLRCSNICKGNFYGSKLYCSGFLCRPSFWEKNFLFHRTHAGSCLLSAVHDVSESSSEDAGTKNLTLEERQKRRVYVGNIPYTVRWQEIKDHMREAGPVQYVHLFLDKLKRSKGSALVEYMTEEGAQRAIELLNNSVIAGRSLVVREDRGSVFPDGERKVYRLVFRSLVPEIRWQEVRERCKPYGNVLRVLIRRSTTGEEAHGVVFFPRLEQAQKAKEALDGAVWDGREVHCELEYDINDESGLEQEKENGTKL